MALNGRGVTVLGAGVGGLAVARALALRGARVRVIEQADAPAAAGAGIQISPNGFAVLAALGLGAAVEAAGRRAAAVVLREHRRGARVLRLDLTRHAAGQRYLFVERGRLIEALARGATAAGVAIETGRPIAEVTAAGRLTDAAGRAEQAALVVAADGVHSVARAALDDRRAGFTGQVAWRAVLDDAAPGPAEAEVFMGPGRHLVSYPLAGGRRNLVAVEERRAWAAESWRAEDAPDNLRAAFAGFAPRARDWLGRVGRVYLWGLFRHPVATPWHGPALALMGDAAHPMLPFLAQGANMALEDAWVLAECLEARPQAEALALYQAERRGRAMRVIAAAEANARNYHLRPPLSLAAHGALRLAEAVAPAAALRRFDWLYRHDVTDAEARGVSRRRPPARR